MSTLGICLVISLVSCAFSLFLNLMLEGRDLRQFPILSFVAKWSLIGCMVFSFAVIAIFDLWC